MGSSSTPRASFRFQAIPNAEIDFAMARMVGIEHGSRIDSHRFSFLTLEGVVQMLADLRQKDDPDQCDRDESERKNDLALSMLGHLVTRSAIGSLR